MKMDLGRSERDSEPRSIANGIERGVFDMNMDPNNSEPSRISTECLHLIERLRKAPTLLLKYYWSTEAFSYGLVFHRAVVD